MTLESFLLHIPSVGELCAITSHGNIMQTAYIDDKKLFISGIKNKEKTVKGWYRDELLVCALHPKITFVPCRYIEIGD